MIQVKNSAYAWRQMIFYLSLLPERELESFLTWATEHLSQQPGSFQHRFRPALAGLEIAFQGIPIESEAGREANARLFLGWSVEPHWLLKEV